MIVYWLLLLPTAFVAYVLGSVSTMNLAGALVFRRDLRKLGRGNQWISNFRRLYGPWGFVKLGLVEVLKALLPMLLGFALLSIKGHGDVGWAFAGFCVLLGRLYPVFNRFRGCHGVLALVVLAFGVDLSAGILAALAAAGLVWFTRYLSLAALGCALVILAIAVMVVDLRLVIVLVGLTALLVLLRHGKAIRRLIKKTEPRLDFRTDLSYKFDE